MSKIAVIIPAFNEVLSIGQVLKALPKSADEIIVLAKGKVVERGTHKALLAQHGVYKKLIELQSFD